MKLKFAGNNALILGGSCDMAVSLAKLMIKSGLFPCLTYRSQKGLEFIQNSLKGHEKKFSTSFLEFGNFDSMDSTFASLKINPDYLIDFVQSDMESLVASANMDEADKYFHENITFRSRVLKAVTRSMIKQKNGRLIFISSAAAYRPNPGQGFYSASKLASEALYKNIGIELGALGITSLILRPGYVQAGRGKNYLDKNSKAVKKVPIKRALTSLEVAEAILFFISKSAIGFNATEVLMDGGLTACK